jgi:hypothetical protein
MFELAANDPIIKDYLKNIQHLKSQQLIEHELDREGSAGFPLVSRGFQRSCNSSRVQLTFPRVPRSGAFRIRSRKRRLAWAFCPSCSIKFLMASAMRLVMDWLREAA